MADRYLLPYEFAYGSLAESAKFNENWKACIDGLNELVTFFRGDSPPTGVIVDGMCWWDSNYNPPVLRKYNASTGEWEWFGTWAGFSAPSNPSKGAVFVSEENGYIKYFNGSAWLSIYEAWELDSNGDLMPAEV